MAKFWSTQNLYTKVLVFFEFTANVVFDQGSLAHGDQITMILGHNESVGTATPSSMFDKLSIVPPMCFVARIKHSPGPTVKV